MLAILIWLFVASPLFSQISLTTLEFGFSNPGARSLGFGGAFVALADDATAAFANPAGLVQLTRTEVSVEGKIWDYQTPYTSGGRLWGLPAGIGLDDNTSLLLRTAESSATLSGLSFLSFVYPKGDWSIAVYRHQLAKFETSVETQGFFGTVSGEDYRYPDIQGHNEFDIATYGVSGAYRFTESFSVGLGLSYFVGAASVQSDYYQPIESTLPDGFFGRNIFDPQARSHTELDEIDDTAWGMSLGALWRINGQWSLGSFYRGAPTFELTVETRTGPAHPDLPPDTIERRQTGFMIDFPGVVGAGLAYQSPGGTTTVSFEWDRVFYSWFTESIEAGADEEQNVAIDDADELRLGVEYVFLKLRPVIALRGGIWLDPDHRIRSFGRDDPLARAFFRAGDDELHGAFGVGVVFAQFQLDFGVDLSELVKSASLSAIFSF
jgi:long-subunit fatty acid transport protein